MKQCLLIWEHGGRPVRARRLVTFWEQAIREAGVEVESALADDPEDARRIAARASEWESIAVAGDDAVVHRVVDGIASIPEGRRPRVGILPLGPRSDLCRLYKIPLPPAPAVQTLIEGVPRALDLGLVRYCDEQGQERTSVFLGRCSIGPAVDMVQRLERWRQRCGERTGALLALLWHCFSCRRIDLDLMVEGERVSLPEVNVLTVLKGPVFAPGLEMNTGVEPDDGHLALVAVQQLGRCGLFCLAPRLLAGTAAESADVACRLCRKVTVEGDSTCSVEVDGVLQGRLPASFEVLPGHIEIIAPPGRE